MNWLNACEIGIKIFTAAVAGVAIFVGIDQAINRRSNKSSKNENGGVNRTTGMFGNQENNPMNHQPPSGAFPDEEQKNKGQKFLDGLKGATSMCSKLLSFAQSLTSVAENFSRIFKDSPDNGGYGGYYGYYPPPPNNYGGWNEMGGQSWRRLSPFVIESVPNYNPNAVNQRYPF